MHGKPVPGTPCLPVSQSQRWVEVEEPAELGLALVCSLASCVALGFLASLSGNDVMNGFLYTMSCGGLVSFVPCRFKNETFFLLSVYNF